MNAIYSWDPDSGHGQPIDTRKAAIATLDVGKDLVALGDFAGRVAVYSLTSRAKIDEFSLQAPIEVVAISPEDSVLFASTGEGTIAICTIGEPTARPWRAWLGTLLAGSPTPELQAVTTEKGAITCRLRKGDERVLRAAFASQQRLIGATKDRVFLASPADDALVFDTLSSEGETRSLEVDRSGDRLAIGGADGVLKIWDLAERQLKAVLQLPNSIQRVRFIPDRPDQIATLDGSTLRLWDLSVLTLLAEACARWQPDERIVPAPALVSLPSRRELCK